MAGLDMMIKTVIENAMKNIPPETLAQIGQIGETVKSFKLQMDRIENQNRLILDHLGISPGNQISEQDNAG